MAKIRIKPSRFIKTGDVIFLDEERLKEIFQVSFVDLKRLSFVKANLKIIVEAEKFFISAAMEKGFVVESTLDTSCIVEVPTMTFDPKTESFNFIYGQTLLFFTENSAITSINKKEIGREMFI